MTVRELMALLSRLDPNTRVVGRGYESGFNYVKTVELLELAEFPDLPHYEGMLQESTGYYADSESHGEAFTAIALR